MEQFVTGILLNSIHAFIWGEVRVAVFQSHTLIPAIFVLLLVISVLSGFVLLNPKVPLKYIWIHTGFIAMPPIAALAGLIWSNGSIYFGPWHFDALSWLLALFVLTIGLIVQRFSIRYLLGDYSYRKYFALLTVTAASDALAWLSNDLRLLLLFWVMTLLGLTMLIGLNKEWQVAKKASIHTGKMFALSWIVLLFAMIWLTEAAGHWQLSQTLTEKSLVQLASWEKTCINLLIVVSIIIPAAQWPFQRWLLDSVVAPTPISAVMHAGIVNAGGIILTKFSPLFSGDMAQIILLIISGISVLIGTGIMLVQVDYKRQLVGSTMAQMGFMLIQCALGAYWAAIIHAILHGLFKATLFLQAGSAIHHYPKVRNQHTQSPLWTITGGLLGILAGIGFWYTSPAGGYQFISAFILGWAVFIAWTGLVAFSNGRIARTAGFLLFLLAAFVFRIVHNRFFNILHESIQTNIAAPITAAVILLFFLLAASYGAWVLRNRSTATFAIIYLWLIRLSEPQADLTESHPKYLTHQLSRGGNVR